MRYELPRQSGEPSEKQTQELNKSQDEEVSEMIRSSSETQLSKFYLLNYLVLKIVSKELSSIKHLILATLSKTTWWPVLGDKTNQLEGLVTAMLQ